MSNEIAVGDRVTWQGGLGWGNWCFGIAVIEAYQPNQTGVYEGFMVQPDGWDHTQFISRASLKKAEQS
jgi:hypothetical protein